MVYKSICPHRRLVAVFYFEHLVPPMAGQNLKFSGFPEGYTILGLVEDEMLVVNKNIAHPWQCDVMGHLTTRFYVGMFDDAAYHFLYEVFGLTIKTVGESKIGWADVRHLIEYKAEVSAGDVLEIRGYLKGMGTTSFTAQYKW